MKAILQTVVSSNQIVLFLIMTLMPGASSASLISLDFRNPGDGALTLDTVTQLEWLDLSYTKGVSYLSISEGWDGITTSEGFRFATSAEIGELSTSVGLVKSSDPIISPAENYSPGTQFQALLGIINTVGHVTYASGYFAYKEPDNRTRPFVYSMSAYSVVLNHENLTGSAGFLGLQCITFNCYRDGIPDYGAFLVRPAQSAVPVPEPSVAALLAIAIAGWLTVVPRRRQRKVESPGSGVSS